jgi:uncharacterized protein (DUF58 family)
MAQPRRAGADLLPIDWGAISPLRLRAQLLAEGVYSGGHRSRRRGPGVEFGGQRPYVPGDDLRFLDRRSLLRHDRLMVRQFETETDRALWLCVDASASMAFRGPQAPGAKLAFAALLAAALARVAVAGQDPVGLAWLGGAPSTTRAGGRAVLDGVAASFGYAAFERVTNQLESAHASGDLSRDLEAVDQSVRLLGLRAGRGSAVVVFSDLLDLHQQALGRILPLASAPRALVVVQVLDPRERDLSFRGKVRLRALEGSEVVVTDADAVRGEYQARLAAHTESCRRAVEQAGGRLVRATSSDDAVQVVRQILQAIAEARR